MEGGSHFLQQHLETHKGCSLIQVGWEATEAGRRVQIQQARQCEERPLPAALSPQNGSETTNRPGNAILLDFVSATRFPASNSCAKAPT